MNICNSNIGAEVGRALRNFKYERAGNRILVPAMGLFIGGAFQTREHIGCEIGPAELEPNLFVNQGLDYLLGAAFGGAAQTSTFYLALFSGNVTPAATWTGANFAQNSTEFQAYASAQRPQWNRGAAANQAIGNAGSEALFEYNAGGPYNIYGCGLLSASAKGATSGILVAATRFTTARTNQQAGDKLGVEYVLTAQDEG